ncbi:diaminopimelate epimerase [Streptomyces sp. NBC_01264]|uniref:diaminopimelate epimerase n=1 Tax=Streptomyces sp. NBC_01264 TaxID=2903804 RepID=UPI00225AB7A5|nr:diaminopimelate epimerase [Streptomyces sp. NBC_01264]MCX4784189.1 diaminopimelate epimerase [Streptomyces sp. NBC_01264]
MTDVKIRFAKGHGAGNDFIVVPDPDGHLHLTADDVKALCHRRTGIGADGLLRAVRSTAEPEAESMSAQADWFMDYRNADGTNGSMCGNGIRVFARYLADAEFCRPGLVSIVTRAGIRQVRIPPADATDDAITVDMGRPRLPGPENIKVTVEPRHWSALNVDMGNPHAVAFIDDLAHAGELTVPPTVTPAAAYPDGVTVEFVTIRGPRRLSVRVHERGVGETSACGTGASAAVAALRQREKHTGMGHYTVDFPGGCLRITVDADETFQLTGPAVIVLEGAFALPNGRTGPLAVLAATQSLGSQ